MRVVHDYFFCVYFFWCSSVLSELSILSKTSRLGSSHKLALFSVPDSVSTCVEQNMTIAKSSFCLMTAATGPGENRLKIPFFLASVMHLSGYDHHSKTFHTTLFALLPNNFTNTILSNRMDAALIPVKVQLLAEFNMSIRDPLIWDHFSASLSHTSTCWALSVIKPFISHVSTVIMPWTSLPYLSSWVSQRCSVNRIVIILIQLSKNPCAFDDFGGLWLDQQRIISISAGVLVAVS